MKKKNSILSTVFSPCLQFVCLFGLLATVISFVAGRLFAVMQMDLGKIIFWNVEYFFVLALFLELLGFEMYLKGKKLLLAGGLYAVSFCLVWLSNTFLILNFWMIGVFLLAFIVPSYLAAVFHVILTISYCLVNGLSVEEFICYFTFGTLILLLTKFMDKLCNMVIILVVACTTNLAFLILLDDFQFDFTADSIHALISTAIMVVFMWAVQVVFDPYQKKEVIVKKQLMEQLKRFSDNLYEHCKQIGTLSEGAARKIGVREDIAYAGGCYHEIGRLEGNEYIEDGAKLLKENGVSSQVIRVVKEHNIHHDVPTSKEAAIVMLSDSIVSTVQFLKARQPDAELPMDNVVDSIFAKRFEKGLLDESMLSMKDIVMLKEYYKRCLAKWEAEQLPE